MLRLPYPFPPRDSANPMPSMWRAAGARRRTGNGPSGSNFAGTPSGGRNYYSSVTGRLVWQRRSQPHLPTRTERETAGPLRLLMTRSEGLGPQQPTQAKRRLEWPPKLFAGGTAGSFIRMKRNSVAGSTGPSENEFFSARESYFLPVKRRTPPPIMATTPRMGGNGTVLVSFLEA